MGVWEGKIVNNGNKNRPLLRCSLLVYQNDSLTFCMIPPLGATGTSPFFLFKTWLLHPLHPHPLLRHLHPLKVYFLLSLPFSLHSSLHLFILFILFISSF